MDFNALQNKFLNLVNFSNIFAFLYACILVIVGYFIAQFISKGLGNLCRTHASPQQIMLIEKFSHYFIFIIFVVAGLEQLGFSLSVLLSAAGVLTVAISIASQTSISNIVSGLFLIGERPFVVGDIILLDPIQGEVLSIDLLSVKLRKTDNTYVRIPNELLIKSTMINLTRFPNRRFDLILGVANDSDLGKVQKVLFDIVTKNTYALKDHPPKFYLISFGESTINVQLSAWGHRKEFDEFKSSLQIEINNAFHEHHISMPYPQRTIHLVQE